MSGLYGNRAVWVRDLGEISRRIWTRGLRETSHQNVYIPMLIPESLLQKEKDHVKGFAPEVAWDAGRRRKAF